jgi:hypothetical protein
MPRVEPLESVPFLLGSASAAMLGPMTPPENLSTFCARAASLAGERPEAYVGSAEHVRDVEGLLAVAPAEIRPELEVLRDFLANGGVDPASPDSNLTVNWPAQVKAAVSKVTEYIAAHC